MNTLSELIECIEANYNPSNNSTIEYLMYYVKQYNGDDWKKYMNTEKTFTRTSIFRSTNFDIYLLYWKKGHATPYHLHPQNGCILKVLEGHLKEDIKDRDDNIITHMAIPNTISYMHNVNGMHRIIALEDTFSLHIYSPSGYYD